MSKIAYIYNNYNSMPLTTIIAAAMRYSLVILYLTPCASITTLKKGKFHFPEKGK